MKEKGLFCCIGNGRYNLIEGRELVRIEIGNILCCKNTLLLLIILSLLCDKGIWIIKNVPSVSHHLWHAIPILKPLSRLVKKLIDKKETIVLDLLLSWLHISILKDMVLKLVFEIITYVLPKSFP